MNAELGAEVCNWIFGELRRILQCPGFFAVQVVLKTAVDIEDSLTQFALATGRKFFIGYVAEQFYRIMVVSFPEEGRKIFEYLLGFGVP